MRIGARINHSSMNYLNGAVASFRLYTRPLIKEQIETLYDYEKVRFGHVSSLDVTLHKGSLGVGAEPSRDDRLAVAGCAKADSVKTPVVLDRNSIVVYEQSGPHDRPLVKYPEIAMTSATVGGYTAEYSSQHNSVFPGWNAFNGVVETVNGANGEWISGSGTYDTSATSGAYLAHSSNSVLFQGERGEYLGIILPSAIKLDYINVYGRPDAGSPRTVRDYILWGSNDGSSWTQLQTGKNTRATAGSTNLFVVHVNATNFYSRFRLQALSMNTNEGGVSIGEMQLYGYEEGDVSTDSTWTSVLNKPETQHLDVYWDGAADSNSYPGAGTEVFDLSGNGVKGTLSGAGFDSTYNAFTFDGSGDPLFNGSGNFITGTLSNPSGDWVHSVSCWVYATELSGSKYRFVSHYGVEATRQQVILAIKNGRVVVDFNNDNIGKDVSLVANTWYHIAFTYSGGGTSHVKIYINGIDIGASGGGTTALNIASNRTLYIGKELNINWNDPWKGSIANFRIFSKVLSADQVKELYAYDAVRFGHRASNSVSLHKGNLGVGVTQPTSRFEVAPADGVFEYPPRGMTGNETYMEGYGVFRVSASSEYGPGGRDAWVAFDNSTDGWQQDGNSWDTNGTNYIGSASFEGASGEFIQLELPHPIKPNQMELISAVTDRMITDGILFGRDANNGTWRAIHILTGYTTWSYNIPQYIGINATEYYDAFTLLVQKISGNTNIHITNMKFFGTPAPSTLDDGHLTLGNALTTPRVSGHAAGVETPRAESLVVHYDTTVDSAVSTYSWSGYGYASTVIDSSGSVNHGTFIGNAAYSSSDRALTFDGTGDYIVKTNASGLPTGDAIFSMSAWIKLQPVASWASGAQWPNIISYGSAWAGTKIGSFFVDTNLALHGTVGAASAFTASGVIIPGTWQHVVAVKSGTGQISTTTYEMYVDGVKLPTPNVNGTNTMNIDSGVSVSIGGGFTGVASDMLTGSIAKPKMWNVALTASEVRAEYALGRTGKALNVTDTAVCIGGVAPRAQFDVRGDVRGGRARFDEIQTEYLEVVKGLSTIKKYDASLTMSSGTWHDIGDFGSPPMANGAYLLTVRWSNSNNSTTWYGGASGIIYIRGDGNAVYNAQAAEDLRLNHWYHYRTVAEFEFKLDSDNSITSYGNTTLYVKGQSNPTITFTTYMTLLHHV
jgi:hypothetical protein